MPWSESSAWIKLMIVSAYKTELGRRKIMLKETVESDILKYAYLSICFIFFCLLYFNAFNNVTPSIRRLGDERWLLQALIKRGKR
jgi:DMSO/TMAO reductase YedYZ heme-binding membrane subunit